MEKRKVLEAYRLLLTSLPPEGQLELVNCSHANEIIDLARRFNYPLSLEECVGIYKMLTTPEHFNRLPPDAIM